MTTAQPIVYIVDDDAAVRDSLLVLLGVQGFATRAFPSAEAFLEACTPDCAGCVLLDLRMPGRNGLALQREMVDRGIALPVIMITAHGDISAVRASFKSGAVDFLEKPLDNAQLIAAVRAALERDAAHRADAERAAHVGRQLDRLTPREREVLTRVVAGRHNREIAVELRISARTVEVHKAKIMDKLGVERLPDLIRLVGTRG